MNRKKVPDILAVIIVLGGILVYHQFQTKNFRKEIVTNMAVSNATVFKCSYRNKHGYVVEYKFETVNSETIYGYVNGSEYKVLRKLIMYKSFPIVYDSTNPTRNFILILPNDFNLYGLEFPDSLNWVISELNKHD